MNLSKIQGNDIVSTHPQWEAVQLVCRVLSQKGFLVYLAGGCVRDLLLARQPYDFDIVTSAKPEQIVELFPEALEVGQSFGVVVLPRRDAYGRGFSIDIATFRKEGEYSDYRHPDSVEFASAEEDARRRDFTMNALFYDVLEDNVIDFVEGVSDLKKGVVRCVGEPGKRFSEDRLRVLRAIRLVTQLGFSMEKVTAMGVRSFAGDVVSAVSQERVTEEIRKTLLSRRRAEGWSLLFRVGLLQDIAPLMAQAVGEEPFDWKLVYYQKTLLTLLGEEQRWSLILACCYWPLACRGHWGESFHKTELLDQIQSELTKLKIDGKTIAETTHLLRHASAIINVKEDVDLWLLLEGEQGLALLQFWSVLLQCNNLSFRRITKVVSDYLRISDSLGQLPRKLLRGDDLLALGLTGADIGLYMAEAFRAQLKGEFDSKEEGIQWLKAKLSQ